LDFVRRVISGHAVIEITVVAAEVVEFFVVAARTTAIAPTWPSEVTR